jgi:2-phospho-L-lactate guanylyltransferase
MNPIAVLPVKSFARAKLRLAPALSPAARAALARSLFDHVLGVVKSSGAVSETLVVTDCPEVATLHAPALVLPGRAPLRTSIDPALATLGHRPAIVLMCDLPLLVASDVRALALALHAHPSVIAPDREALGTNALALRDAAQLPTCFGRPDSFAAHLARHPGAHVLRTPGLAHDLDTPGDLIVSRARAA